MAGNEAPFGKPKKSALAEGAARFESLANELKAQQTTESRGEPSTAYRMPATSPDEEWSKSYMTAGIGPKPEMLRNAGIAMPVQMPSVSFDFTNPQPVVPKPVLAPPDVPREAMGARLGKPVPRRSWLGRLFGGHA